MPWRILILAVAVAGLWPGPEPEPRQKPPAPAPETRPDRPRRVVVEVGRNREVPGFVKHEDTDYIVVETTSGEIESFAKARVLKIVRLVDPEPGQKGTVVLRDGQRREGVILEDGFEQVVMEINGVRSTLARQVVDYVVLHPTFEQRYAQYKASARTPRQHLGLCQWLVDERRYRLAHEEIVDLLAKEPLPEARQMLKLVEAQLALEEDGGGPPAEDRENDAGPDLPVLALLSHKDVNLIRVYEIDFDNPPRVSIAPETIQTMIQMYGAQPEIPASEMERRALFRADPLELVELMFRLRARELYPAIDVLTEPASLNMFRRRVHNTWLLNSCGSARCHGGPDAGRFFLHRRRYKDERVRYTNLLILERLRLDPDWPLVNYDDPMNSLIIQYGLPRNQARKPHPEVKGWKPVFGRGGHRMLSDTVAWIEAMMQPRPIYPVEYEPPNLAATTMSETPPDAPPPDREPR